MGPHMLMRCGLVVDSAVVVQGPFYQVPRSRCVGQDLASRAVYGPADVPGSARVRPGSASSEYLPFDPVSPQFQY